MNPELDARSRSSLNCSARRRGPGEAPRFPDRRVSKCLAAALLGCAAFAAAPSQAAPGSETAVTEPETHEAVELSEPMRTAMLLAKAAGGGIGFVGSALAVDEATTPSEVAIIQSVGVEKMKTGEIVMLVKDDCKAPTGCLLARRITEKRGSEVATRRYGRPAADAGQPVDASVVGRVAYAVDLDTGRIRDMRHDDTKEISIVEALRREAKKWHYVGNTVRPRPLRI